MYTSIKLYFHISIFLLLYCFANIATAQVYYKQNGEHLPDPKADTLYIKKGIYKGYEAEFGTLLVHENRKNKSSKLIDIPVIRVFSITDSDHPPVFLLNGGPGLSNIWDKYFPEFLLDSFDIIMVGYRGVDGSVQLDSRKVKDFLYHADNPLHKNNIKKLQNIWNDEIAKRSKDTDLLGYNINEVCLDIESVRSIYNIPKIHFYAYSYGSMLVQYYITHFKTHVAKNVFICPRPVTDNNFTDHDMQILKMTIDSLLIYEFNLSMNSKTDFYDFLNTDLWKINGMDKSRLSLIILNNFYALKNTKNTIEVLLKAKKGNYNDIMDLSNTLSMHYDKLIALDCVLKRNSIKPNTYPLNSIDTVDFFSTLARSGNNCWNSAADILPKDYYNEPISEIDIPTLFISGTNDFVSPSYLITEKLQYIFSKNTYYQIPNASHEDVLIHLEKENERVKEFLR